MTLKSWSSSFEKLSDYPAPDSKNLSSLLLATGPNQVPKTKSKEGIAAALAAAAYDDSALHSQSSESDASFSEECASDLESDKSGSKASKLKGITRQSAWPRGIKK